MTEQHPPPRGQFGVEPPAATPATPTQEQRAPAASTLPPLRGKPNISLPSIGIGLAIGLVAGFGLGWAIPNGSAGPGHDSSAAAVDEEASEVLSPFPRATVDCGLQRHPAVTRGDQERTLDLDGVGEDSLGLAFDEQLCILDALDVPDSVISKMESTRALDGRQEASWDNIIASWTYHPDDGLDVLLELDD